MPQQFHLLPTPKQLTPHPGAFPLPKQLHIVLQDHAATRPLFAPERFILEAEPLTHTHLEMSLGNPIHPPTEIAVRHNPDLAPSAPDALRDQAYHLSITPNGITLAARAAPGIFYAFQTLLQLIRHAALTQKPSAKKPLALPCLTIDDLPDFARRGVYHDTARGKVPTLATLLQLVDDLGHLKYNEFQLYVENNFAFRRHPDMYDDTDPLTSEELLILDAACRARHIDFVPSLTSLGHFEKILNRPRYRPLAEAEPAQLKAINATCWFESAPWSLAVSDPSARQLLKEMYDEFAPNFSSPHFNICCDEAYDLGVIRSKEEADRVGGVGQLYVNWINYCRDLALTHNKSIQMWGDIILKYPDLISQLPEKAVLLEWGYEHDHKFDDHCKIFADRLSLNSGLSTQDSKLRSFYVAPGTSSWLTLSSRTKNACGNIHNAATAGLKYAAAGLLVTDWGDNGHQQLLAVSMLPFAYGAAAGWNLAATPNPSTTALAPRKSDLLTSISLHLFQDPTGAAAPLAYELGLMYELFGWQRFNASVDWFLFREKWAFANYVNRVSPKALHKVISACEKLRTQFQKLDLLHAHGNDLTAEFVFTCDEIIHTCKRTLLRQAWLAADPAKRNPEEETLRNKRPQPLPKTFAQEMKGLEKDAAKLSKRFEDLWLARNKPSRLADVTAEFARLIAEYRQFAKSK